jgi:hypothetical protein
MPVDLAPLAEQAGPSHQSDGLGRLWLAKSGCDEALCRPHTPEAADMNGRFQMQGGKNWILPK